MAKSNNNIVMHGASGQLGSQIVFRKGRGGQMIISAMPAAGRTFNPAQQAHQEAFRQAIAYAKAARHEVTYLTRAQGTTMTAFNAAVADWFGEPQVLEVDISAWTGQIGQVIQVRAKDNVQVTRVHVMIRASNASATALEEGDAVPSETDGLLWTYTTTTVVPMNPGTRVDVTAHDLAGNMGGNAVELP